MSCTAKDPRILIVDDNDQIHGDFRRSFERATPLTPELTAMEGALFGDKATTAATVRGYRLDSAMQGEEALRMVLASIEQNDRYALAFVDMRMPPGWDGLKTIEMCWNADPDIQIVICTAYSDYSWDEIRQRLGSSDRLLILRKPFDRVEVCQMAASLTEKWRLANIARRKQNELEELVSLRTRQLEEALKQDRLRLDLLETIVEHRTAELRHASLHDKLTGLPNRSMISDQLTLAIRHFQENPASKFAVLFLDLDDFKLVNDTLGHEAGDRLLTAVADRLTKCLRSHDRVALGRTMTAARLGGDEFVILLENLREHSDAECVAARLLESLTQPFDLSSRQIRCGVSIGVTTSATSYDSVEQILRDADIAMYCAKSEKNRFVTFDSQMHAEVVARVSLEDELRRAVNEKELELYYQPIVSLASGQLEGFEALIRWNHPDRGCVTPDVFIPLAETTGLIETIGLWTLEQAATQSEIWRKAFPAKPISISVNISPRQLRDGSLLSELNGILARTGADPSRLILEITEGFLAENHGNAEKLLQGLRELKIRTHLDDFGTGYSSLGRLPALPIDGVKIDRVFVREARSQRKYAAIINAIVNLARHMDASVIAEGIESLEQVALLQAMDCQYGQGYYFSRPVPVGQAERCFGDNWWVRQPAIAA